MMVNIRRGEIAARLDEKDWTLCLTLGALAQLEAAFGVEDLGKLGERFSSGRLSANDMITIISAGLNGAGNKVSLQQVAVMHTEGGILGFADIVTRLLLATFEGDKSAKADSPNP